MPPAQLVPVARHVIIPDDYQDGRWTTLVWYASLISKPQLLYQRQADLSMVCRSCFKARWLACALETKLMMIVSYDQLVITYDRAVWSSFSTSCHAMTECGAVQPSTTTNTPSTACTLPCHRTRGLHAAAPLLPHAHTRVQHMLSQIPQLWPQLCHA